MRKRYLILFVWMSILLFSCNGKEVNMVENIQTNEQMESNDEQKNIKIATNIFENNEIIKKILEMKPVTDFDISASVDDFDTVTSRIFFYKIIHYPKCQELDTLGNIIYNKCKY